MSPEHDGLETRLKVWAGRRGYRLAWTTPEVLPDLHNDIRARFNAGSFDLSFYRRCVSGIFPLLGSDEASIPEKVNSVIIIGMPDPPRRAVFELPDGPVEAVIPTSFRHYWDKGRQTAGEVADLLGGKERLIGLRYPFKGIAVRAGFAVYGRNNVTHVSGWGSYYRLLVLGSDVVLSDPVPPQPPEMRAECHECLACVEACPTGALGRDRTLLRGELCLTLYNDKPEPWPAWISPSSHNALVGCNRCMEVCPLNQGIPEEEPVRFTPAESRAALAGTPRGERDEAWDGVLCKLEDLGISRHADILGRNLRALMPARTE